MLPENPHVSFIPYLSRDKHSKRSHRLHRGALFINAFAPPLYNVLHVLPTLNVHHVKAHPKLDGVPNSSSEPAFELKMSRPLLLLIAKLANTTI
jgi:hypothetical protein